MLAEVEKDEVKKLENPKDEELEKLENIKLLFIIIYNFYSSSITMRGFLFSVGKKSFSLTSSPIIDTNLSFNSKR